MITIAAAQGSASSPPWILYLIGAIVVLALLGVAAYFVTRMMKGKIEIELPKRGFNTGETISGKITLTTKKELELERLFVALVGHEIIDRRRRNDDSSSGQDRNEIYRDEVNLAEAQTLAAGFHQSYDFAIPAPGVESVGEAGLMNLGPLTLTLGSQRNRRLEWKLEARADLPGVDIASSKSLRVNVS